MEAKWQLSPSHVQESLAWIQIPRCRITQCFPWISSQLQALTIPDQHAAVTFFFVCVMPLCRIGTKRGFIHHFLSLCCKHRHCAAFVVQVGRERMDTGIPCFRQTRAADRTWEKSPGCSSFSCWLCLVFNDTTAAVWFRYAEHRRIFNFIMFGMAGCSYLPSSPGQTANPFTY